MLMRLSQYAFMAGFVALLGYVAWQYLSIVLLLVCVGVLVLAAAIKAGWAP